MSLFSVLVVVLLLDWRLITQPHGPWREVAYRGHTTYVAYEDSAEACVRAEARGTNSALFYRIPTGYQLSGLRWRWRVLRHPAGANTSVKGLDDRAAAVFVLVHRSIFPGRSRGLLYQWANGRDRGHWTRSPYEPGIKVITLENAPADSGWRSEQRDLREDLRVAFGAVPTKVEAVGILCDADDTGGHAIADFGPLEILARDAAR